jgi:drug/metabolite transporter (DMT)-like permease
LDLSCDAGTLAWALALAAAFMFAVGVQFTRYGVEHTDSPTATMIQIGTAAGLYWLAAPWFLEAWYWLQPALLLLAAIGLFRPFITGNLAMAGTKRLGPTISSTMSSTSPLFGLAFGVLLLGESVSARVMWGTVLVMCGVAVLSSRGRLSRDWPLWALLLPVAAGALRVLAQAFAKIGMESIPSAYFVGLVGYSVSFVLALLTHSRRAGRGPVRGPGFKWLALAGACYALAILCLNSALACGALVRVSPVIAGTPVFSLILGRYLFRETQIDARAALAVLIVVPGVALVSLG